jgi:3-hydroxyisobutyrate dehydrogenase-like beta-hydroxyacid dehydrogenase
VTAGLESVAVLGCGLMGSAVARALALAGYDVVVWNRTPAKALALVAERVRAVPTAREAMTSAGVVISVLSDHDALYAAWGTIRRCVGARSWT